MGEWLHWSDSSCNRWPDSDSVKLSSWKLSYAHSAQTLGFESVKHAQSDRWSRASADKHHTHSSIASETVVSVEKNTKCWYIKRLRNNVFATNRSWIVCFVSFWLERRGCFSSFLLVRLKLPGLVTSSHNPKWNEVRGRWSYFMSILSIRDYARPCLGKLRNLFRRECGLRKSLFIMRGHLLLI
jgi:hypothetical protein